MTITATVARSTQPRLPRQRSVGISPLQEALSLGLDEPVTVVSPQAADRASLERCLPRLCSVLVEILTGDRNVQQLLRWTTEEVYADLVGRQMRINHACGRDQRVRSVSAKVRNVRVYWASPRAAEVSVHIRQGGRSRALAARIEMINGRWLCSALEVG